VHAARSSIHRQDVGRREKGKDAGVNGSIGGFERPESLIFIVVDIGALLRDPWRFKSP